MHSFQHSRARILFEVACAFGLSASCVWAWMQTYASAFLPAAAITALYGLVHAFDMIRRRPAAERVVEAAKPATEQRDQPTPVVQQAPEPEAAPVEVVLEAAAKPKRKPARRDSRKMQPAVIEAAEEAVAEVAEVKPAMHVVETAPDEPEYFPATPLFEPEPFLRQQRAAFGRKAR